MFIDQKPQPINTRFGRVEQNLRSGFEMRSTRPNRADEIW